MKWRKSWLYLLLIYIFFYLPIVGLIVLSFNNSQYTLTWQGFSLRWYHDLFADGALWQTALHSIIIGFTAATCATIIGTLAAVCIYRYRFFGKNLLYILTFILIVAPDIVLGTAFLVFYSSVHFPLGFWSLLLAHISFCIPFVIVTVYSRITTLDKRLFEAAKDLGATDNVIFFKIIVPLLYLAIIAGWLLSFTLSFDDVIISYFVSGPSFQILPLYIYSMVRAGINPEVNALTTILLLFTLLLVFLLHFTMRKTDE